MSAQEFAELLVLTYNQTNWLTAPATKTLTINDIDLTFVANPAEITRAEVAFLIDKYFDTNLVVTFGQKTAALLSTIADILATKDTAAQYDIINKLIDLIPTLDNSDIYPFTKDQILMILKKVAASK